MLGLLLGFGLGFGGQGHAQAKPGTCCQRSKRTEAEPAAEPTQPTEGEGKAAKAKPAPQPGRWVDRDCNAALNMQRFGESRWRPLELCYWPEQGKLSAKGKEYPELGYKRVRDKPPKAQQQQQQQQPAAAQYVLRNTTTEIPFPSSMQIIIIVNYCDVMTDQVHSLPIGVGGASSWLADTYIKGPGQVEAPCGIQAAKQTEASKPGPSTPQPAKRSKRTKVEQAAEPTQPTKGKGKAAKAKPAPQPGRWVDMDCNAALNMQRIGRWRPLELCWWPE
ncbi:hypothetical protein QJQ45_001855 [Haematococcus lacustris]|nr:hypothetical protein QJQ45_001855 [Haematococcus lacustris]